MYCVQWSDNNFSYNVIGMWESIIAIAGMLENYKYFYKIGNCPGEYISNKNNYYGNYLYWLDGDKSYPSIDEKYEMYKKNPN